LPFVAGVPEVELLFGGGHIAAFAFGLFDKGLTHGGTGAPLTEEFEIFVEADEDGDALGAVVEVGVHEFGVLVSEEHAQMDVSAGLSDVPEHGDDLRGVGTPGFGNDDPVLGAVYGTEGLEVFGVPFPGFVDALNALLIELGVADELFALFCSRGAVFADELVDEYAVFGIAEPVVVVLLILGGAEGVHGGFHFHDNRLLKVVVSRTAAKVGAGNGLFCHLEDSRGGVVDSYRERRLLSQLEIQFLTFKTLRNEYGTKALPNRTGSSVRYLPATPMSIQSLPSLFIPSLRL